MPARKTDAWIEALSARDVPCSRIATPGDLLHDPHLAEIGFFDVPEDYPAGMVRMVPQPVRFDTIASAPDMPPAGIGADSHAVLRECGYDEAAIAALTAAGVVRRAPD
jgi:crotonobetainyl-CoA:carnitine CoA-transferase CaiB-like acyl-CoA transferase